MSSTTILVSIVAAIIVGTLAAGAIVRVVSDLLAQLPA